MKQIAATDAGIIRLLQDCNFPNVTIQSAPHTWDDGYIQRLLTSTPTILVAFAGAEPHSDDDSTSLNLAGRWGIYPCVGWNGQSEKDRRLAMGGGLDLLHRTASALHNAILREADGSRLPMVSVVGLDVLTDGAVDIANLWIGAVEIKVKLPLDLLPECTGPLDDFLRVRGPLVVPDPADDIDIAVDLPQS